MGNTDYTAEAQALFQRFADRHGLSFEIEQDAPIEVLWWFPKQPGLSMPITLGLQNGDELNFGVSDFWSYFFTFDAVAEEFEQAIDAWVRGDARIAVGRGRGRKLQLRDGEKWKNIYGADGCLLPIPSRIVRYEINRPAAES